MKELVFEKKGNDPLYVQLYYYFRKLIECGQLENNSKMMSIRRCCEEFGLSKTTVENAYLQLAAEGYIISKPQSGYYVCQFNFTEKSIVKEYSFSEVKNEKIKTEYDFTSSSVDSESFDFSLWQRYIKSALRQSERLISYGDVQGEPDLRSAVSAYINNNRSVVCSSEQIVIGAGTQILLSVLCSLIPEKCNIAFIGSSFERGEAVFEDYGHECFRFKSFPESLDELSEKNIKLIFISPSHFTEEGDILPINQRIDLLNYAKKNDCLIIEDDYDSEFRYYSKPIPSLQGIAGGNEVIYISTFSKLLIPSIRISFMVLPFSLLSKYKEKGRLYNQTASKLEQIALCQFIRDGHLNVQIRKQRKLFSQKSKALCDEIKKVFGDSAKAKILPAGYLVKLTFLNGALCKDLSFLAGKKGILMPPIKSEKEYSIILSCTSVPIKKYFSALSEIKSIINEKSSE